MKLWQAPEEIPGGDELLTRVLTCLDGVDVIRLLHVEKRSRDSVLKLVKSFQRARGRLALALLCFSRLRIEFQAFYQVLETQNIPRSSDPRVPPRVVSIWTERGEVAGGSVALKPIEFPSVHNDGVSARFAADVNAAGKRPMLTNVVQRNRRIYTTVTIKLLRSDAEDGGSGCGDGLVLRQYTYLKEFGEWKTPTMPEKRKLAAASIGSRRGRFDLLSQDGSAVLELEVPAGTDAQMDYYLVKQAAVSLHMQELLQLHFHSLRPIRPLPLPGQQKPCTISISFRTMTGTSVGGCRMPGFIAVERQDEPGGEHLSGATSGEERDGDARIRTRQHRTGIEKFDVITCQADRHALGSANLALPSDPGYVWFEVRGAGDTTSSNLSFYAVALHYGAQLVPEHGGLRVMQLNWLPGVLESSPTLESRRRRCLKGSLRVVTSSYDGAVQELTMVAQQLPAARLERYAARIASYTRLEA